MENHPARLEPGKGKYTLYFILNERAVGPVMNLARIKLLAFVLHALCVVQTVSLHKIASAMPTTVERDSNLLRLQRFLAGYALNLDIIAKVIFALLPVKTGLVLSLDRTNWKFGEVNINILMLGVTHKGVAFPLLFTMLDKRGNSNWKERTRLIDRFILEKPRAIDPLRQSAIDP